MNNDFQERIQAVRDRVDIAAVIGAAIALDRGRNPRGKCPFHGSKSDSFAVYPDKGHARCWGCGWSGDAIKFVVDHYGLPFKDALERLEADHGLDGLAAARVRREKQAAPVRERAYIDSAELGRFIWKTATKQADPVRTYFRARGVPEAMLGADRFADIRFHGLAPIMTWPKDGPAGQDGPPRDWPKAPAIAALIRRPPADPVAFCEGGECQAAASPHEADARHWPPIGLHVTFLAPDLAGKMVRQKRDGELYPARKMLGQDIAGGCVILGRYRPDCRLFLGEGLETVLSGMALFNDGAGAGPDDCGLAALSLDNLEGKALRWRNGVLPLFDIRPDPNRPALSFAHDGPVIGLVDADMKPLRGPRDPETGKPRGLPVVERRGGPIVWRTITPAERAMICGDLIVKNWRAAGCRHVTAVRPRMGNDFNDAIREMEGVE